METSVKVLQKELQGARLDSEQVGGDLAAAQEQLQEVEVTLTGYADEIAALVAEQAQVRVGSLPIRLASITNGIGYSRHCSSSII